MVWKDGMEGWKYEGLKDGMEGCKDRWMVWKDGRMVLMANW